MNSILRLMGKLKVSHIVADLEKAAKDLAHVAVTQEQRAEGLQLVVNGARSEADRARRILARFEALVE